MRRLRQLTIINLLIWGLFMASIESSLAFQGSVLSSGKWVRIEVNSRGIYKITKDDLVNSGFSETEITPSKIKIFGNGGKVLPQRNSDSRPVDLVENSIYIEGGSDGVFDDSDYILFYADGPDSLQFRQDNSIAYQKHPYSNSSFYFLTIDSNDGKRITLRNDEGSGFTPINYYHDLFVHEEEEHNILQALITSYGGSGREWYGEQFKDNLTQSFTFEVDNLYGSGETTLISSLLAVSKSVTSFNLAVNSAASKEIFFEAIPDSRYGVKGKSNQDTLIISNAMLGTPANISVELQYTPANTIEDAGYVNYLLLNTERDLQKGSTPLYFQNLETNTTGSFTYGISNLSSGDVIWDISDPLNPVMQEFSVTGGIAHFGITSSQLHRFVSFNDSEALIPESLQVIENQDLRSITTPDFLIVTNNTFLPEAERLAAFRLSNDGLDSRVVTIEQIFNEFGSGSPDPTSIRDFVKFLYDKSSNLKYLLFFGKTSYDPKNRIAENTNQVPTYISRNSLDPLRSYTSDDYFGFLEDHEGDWLETLSGDHTVEIGIGRLPVKDLSEARILVDKIINYSSSQSALGKHLNEVYFVGDYGDGNYHMDQSNQLATMVDTAFIDFHANRFFLDNFELLEQTGRSTLPDATKKLTEVVNGGALIINYTGHGGEEGLSNQFLLRIPDMDSWVNQEKLPLLVTATCEFGRHDDPYRVSAGELALLKEDGGCIALVTTARPVFASTNFELNQAFYGRVFKKVNGEYPRLGDVFAETKNNSLNGPNNRNFSLLGDPSMKLLYPKNDIVIETINGKQADRADTLSRLTKVQVGGQIVDPSGNKLSSYSGTLNVIVYDKPSVLQTLGQDSQPFQYNARESLLFTGLSSVVQGNFNFEFVLPQDISSEPGSAKILLYAGSESTLQDANGGSLDLIIGGENPNPGSDNLGPNVQLFMEDVSFRDGGVAGSNTVLLARLEDESGINLLSGANELRAVLDDDIEYTLSNYYVADTNTFTEGWVIFPVEGISPGLHTMRVFASDVYNNQTETAINFRVENERRLIIEDLINYPNPVIDGTTFKFSHNRSGDNLYIQISIISTSGEIVQNLEWHIDNAPSIIDGLRWGDGNFFDKNLTPGVYVGRLLVRSRIDGVKNQAFHKLLIIK